MTETNLPRLVANGTEFEAAPLIHRVHQPAGPGPHRTVVMLHGRRGDEDAMWPLARTLPNSNNWLVAAPRGIKPDPEGGYAWHPRKPDEWPPLGTFDEAVAAVAGFVRALPDNYGADPRRIYLMGFSQGAATAYAIAMRHPGLVQGIAGIVGFAPSECGDVLRSAPLAGLPIFMAAGRADPLIPLERAATCARTLREGGALLEYHEYDAGHKLHARGFQDLKRWWRQRG